MQKYVDTLKPIVYNAVRLIALEVRNVRIDCNALSQAMATADMGVLETAKKAGVSVSTMANIRNGKSCRPKTLGRIAQALGVQVTQLIVQEPR